MIYLDFIKCLTSSRVTSPPQEVGKKAQAVPGVEVSSAELTQGTAAKHFPSPRSPFQMASPPLPRAGVCLLCISAVLGIIKQKESETLQRGAWSAPKMRIRIQNIGDKLDKQPKKDSEMKFNKDNCRAIQ